MYLLSLPPSFLPSFRLPRSVERFAGILVRIVDYISDTWSELTAACRDLFRLVTESRGLQGRDRYTQETEFKACLSVAAFRNQWYLRTLNHT